MLDVGSKCRGDVLLHRSGSLSLLRIYKMYVIWHCKNFKDRLGMCGNLVCLPIINQLANPKEDGLMLTLCRQHERQCIREGSN
jgi:hypothetical protein